MTGQYHPDQAMHQVPALLRHVDHIRAERDGECTILRARKYVEQDEALIVVTAPSVAGVRVFPGSFFFEVVRQSLLWWTGDAYGGVLDLTEFRSVRYAAMAACGDELHLEARVAPLRPGRPIDVYAVFRKPDGQLVARMDLEFAGGGAPSAPDTVPMTAEEVLRWLPYRDPLILVDRVVRHEPGRSIETLKAITNSDPVFRRRPDGGPLASYAYPAGLVLNSWMQAVALLVKALSERNGTVPTASARAVSVRGFRTHRRVYPGDVLRNVVRLNETLYGCTYVVSGECFVGDDPVADGSAVMTVQVPPESTPTLSASDQRN